MEKQIPSKQKHSKKNVKQRRCEIRLSCAQHVQFASKASQAGLSLSEFFRIAAAGKVIAPLADKNAATELRRLGAMLKHLYPKDSNWTTSEKRQYWSAMHTLLGVAKNLDGKGFKGKPKNLSKDDQDQSDVG